MGLLIAGPRIVSSSEGDLCFSWLADIDSFVNSYIKCSFVSSCIKCLLNVYYVPGNVEGPVHIETKTYQVPVLRSLQITDNKSKILEMMINAVNSIPRIRYIRGVEGPFEELIADS